MKKYIVFAISLISLFLLLFFSVEVLLGLFLTFTHVPNINEAWNASATLPQQIMISSSSNPLLLALLAFLSATAAYFISQKFAMRTYNTFE